MPRSERHLSDASVASLRTGNPRWFDHAVKSPIGQPPFEVLRGEFIAATLVELSLRWQSIALLVQLNAKQTFPGCDIERLVFRTATKADVGRYLSLDVCQLL